MPEPGINLSRLLAVERNAMTALNTATELVSSVSALLQRIARLEQQTVQLQAENMELKGRLYSLIGSGPTHGNHH